VTHNRKPVLRRLTRVVAGRSWRAHCRYVRRVATSLRELGESSGFLPVRGLCTRVSKTLQCNTPPPTNTFVVERARLYFVRASCPCSRLFLLPSYAGGAALRPRRRAHDSLGTPPAHHPGVPGSQRARTRNNLPHAYACLDRFAQPKTSLFKLATLPLQPWRVGALVAVASPLGGAIKPRKSLACRVQTPRFTFGRWPCTPPAAGTRKPRSPNPAATRAWAFARRCSAT
jgi:hypothetical protein